MSEEQLEAVEADTQRAKTPVNWEEARELRILTKNGLTAYFEKFMKTMGLDLNDPSITKTPSRVAKMFVDETCMGLFHPKPKMTAQPNEFEYDNMLIETNITVHSMCEHHFVPIIGFAHVAYIPKDRVLGLSKFNRVVDWYSRRPQVQEKLTQQIIEELKEVTETEDVAVVIDAAHMCVKLRGIKDQQAITRTASLSGKFKNDPTVRSEFYQAIPSPKSLV